METQMEWIKGALTRLQLGGGPESGTPPPKAQSASQPAAPTGPNGKAEDDRNAIIKKVKGLEATLASIKEFGSQALIEGCEEELAKARALLEARKDPAQLHQKLLAKAKKLEAQVARKQAESEAKTAQIHELMRQKAELDGDILAHKEELHATNKAAHEATIKMGAAAAASWSPPTLPYNQIQAMVPKRFFEAGGEEPQALSPEMLAEILSMAYQQASVVARTDAQHDDDHNPGPNDDDVPLKRRKAPGGGGGALNPLTPLGPEAQAAMDEYQQEMAHALYNMDKSTRYNVDDDDGLPDLSEDEVGPDVRDIEYDEWMAPPAGDGNPAFDDEWGLPGHHNGLQQWA